MSESRFQNIGKSVINPLLNINTLINKAEKLFQTEIENENNRYSTVNDNEEKIKSNHKKSKSLNRLYSSIPKDPNRFNVVKKIQNIKLMARNNNSNDPYKIYKSKVAFDKNNIDFVFEPRRQIIEYKKRKANRLTDKDGSLSKFLLENKLIGINNYMISLLKSESDRLIYKENENNKKIENMELKNKENNEKFNTIVEKQNKALETIENALHNLHQKIIEFEEEAREKKIIEKSIDEQMQKILKSLDELRTYGKFVSKVIQRDHNNFDNKIFSKKNNNNNLYNSSNTIDFRDLTSNAIDNYKFVIERNKEDEKELNELLEDPNTMLIKFNEIEDRILRFLNERIIDENQKRNDKKEIDNIKKEMYIRYNFLQREFDSLTELFQNESNNLPIMRKICGIEDTKGASELIEEIYYDMCYNDEYNFKKNKLMKITDIIHDCIHRIYIKEEEVNKQINILEKLEKENMNLFYQVIMNRKLENKEEKLIEQKKLLEKIQEQKRIKSEQRFKKIIIKSRKTEAPFRSFKQSFQNIQEKIVTPQPIITQSKIHLGHHRHSMSHNNEFDMIIY